MRRGLLLGLVLVGMLAGCGDDGIDTGALDGGALDGGVIDGGALDGGEADAGAADGGAVDAGAVDAGAVDGGQADAGEVDGGALDGGALDGGALDGGEADAGARLCSVPGGSCDLALQDCPEDQACYATSDGTELSVSCSVLLDLGAEGDPCGAVSECRPGLTCRAGVCRQYCCPEGGLGCPSDRECARYFEAPNLGHCLPITACDPVTSAGCGAAEGCYMGVTPRTLSCYAAGSETEGAACAAKNHCAPGMFCLGAGPFECMRACDTSRGDADCTTAAHTCQEVPSLLPAGVGVCAPPE